MSERSLDIFGEILQLSFIAQN